MNKILGYAVVFFVGLGFGYLAFHSSTAPKGSMPGAQVQNDTFNFTGGFNAGTTNQFGVSSTGALSTTAGITTTGALTAATFNLTAASSSSSPAALGAAVTGHIIVAAAATTANASTTAITANSDVQLQVEQVTPIAGTTCNTTIPTSTPVVSGVVAGNGFIAKVANAPITNPLCLSFSISN